MSIFTTTSSSLSAGSKTNGVGNNQITRYSPFSPIPVYNPSTSYGASHNVDFGKFQLRKVYHKASVSLPASPVKPPKIVDKTLKKIADQITEQSCKVKSIAPRELNNPLNVSQDYFVSPLSKTPNPKASKTSPDNYQ